MGEWNQNSQKCIMSLYCYPLPHLGLWIKKRHDKFVCVTFQGFPEKIFKEKTYVGSFSNRNSNEIIVVIFSSDSGFSSFSWRKFIYLWAKPQRKDEPLLLVQYVNLNLTNIWEVFYNERENVLLTRIKHMPITMSPSRAANHRPILWPSGPKRFVPIR